MGGHPSSKNTRDLHIDPILWGSLVMDEFKILSTFLGVGPLNINCKHVASTMGINSISPNCIADITFTKYTIVRKFYNFSQNKEHVLVGRR